MTYQEFSNFPFIDFGVLLMMIAVAVQIVRGKFTLTGGIVDLIKTNKSAFDQDSDPLVIQLAQIARMEPSQMRRFLETGYLLATGEQMNVAARTTLAENVHASPLKKDVPLVGGFPLSGRYKIFNSPVTASADALTINQPTPSSVAVAQGLQNVAEQFLENESGASG